MQSSLCRSIDQPSCATLTVRVFEDRHTGKQKERRGIEDRACRGEVHGKLKELGTVLLRLAYDRSGKGKRSERRSEIEGWIEETSIAWCDSL